MEYVHRCSFCSWARLARGPVMLHPTCPGCGCALDALRRELCETRRSAPAQAPTRAVRCALYALVILFAAVLLVSAARYGLDAGGLPGAMIGIGGAGFAVLPLMPQRFAAGYSRR